MKKKFKSLAIVASMCLMLVGCGTKLPEEITYDNMFDYDISSNLKLGEYKNLEVTKDSTEVTDEQVEKEIAATLASKKTKVENSDRTVVESGDDLTVDYTGYLDGEAFEGGSATDATVSVGSGQFIPGFEEAYIGHSVGEEFEFNVTFPAAYQSTELAGKEVTFKTTIKSLTAYEVPELTDEFVTANSETSKTVAEYKEEVYNNLSESAVANAESNLENALWTKVIEASEVKKYPKVYVDYYQKDLKEYQEYYLSMIGYTLEQYLEAMNLSQDEYDEQVKTSAENSVKSLMVYQALIKDANITLSDEEYQTGLAEYLTSNEYADEAALIEKEGESAPKQIKNNLLLDKAIVYLKDNANIK